MKHARWFLLLGAAGLWGLSFALAVNGSPIVWLLRVVAIGLAIWWHLLAGRGGDLS